MVVSRVFFEIVRAGAGAGAGAEGRVRRGASFNLHSCASFGVLAPAGTNLSFGKFCK